MEHETPLGRIFRGVALTLILVFFMFPIVWIVLMSFQTNEHILRIPPHIFFEPTLANYKALISGQLRTAAGNLEISFMRNLFNSFVLSSAAVLLALLLGVPAAYAFARFKFRLGETIAFTLLSFRFAPPLLVLLPLSLYYQELGLNDTYFGYRLGLSADRVAADPVDRARLLRRCQPRHRACLSACRPFLARSIHADCGAARGPRHCGRGALVFHLLLEQFHLRPDPGLCR